MADDGKIKRDDDTVEPEVNAAKRATKPRYDFPDEDDEINAAGFDWEVTKRLAGYVTPYKQRIYLAMLAALLSVFSSIVGPRLIGYIIEEGVRGGSLQLIGLGVLAYVGVQGLGALGFRGQFFLMSVAGQRAIQALRDDLFSHVNRLSMSFFSQYKTGRIIARIINDVMVLREAITFAVVGTFRDVLVLIGIVISMATMNLPLTGVALSVLVVLVIIANFWRIYARRTYLRVRETNSKVNSELSEAFNGVRVTQAFDRQAYNFSRFAGQIDLDHRSASVRASLVAALFFPTIELIGGVATGTLIYAGGILVLNQSFDVATFVAFVLYIDQFFFPIRMLAQRYNIFQSVMAAGAKVFMLLDTPYEIADAPDAVELPSITGRVSFEDVGFSYDEDSDDGVLHGVNLDVPAGYTVAFVGHTGAGKSTVIKLITRFYDVDKGRLLIDGYDVRDVTQNSLRSQIGVVLQEPYLFSGTVMENIRYGRLAATDGEVIEAAKAVGADDFIGQLEEGYATEVREGGALLSAGQRQLLSFARALLADPRILILDEATSNIDTQTERIIQSALARLLKGRTSFVIAHRLSTIVSSDLIVVLDRGEIVEKGTHADLLLQGGIYRGLYTMSAQ
jgi:ATP-binding cassette, subfamily B, multidrug efflux pump